MNKKLILAALAGVLALPVASADSASTRDKVTGGGQAFLDSRDAKGAGDTVAFQAQRERGAADGSDAADGQIQVNRRGDNAVKFHGEITCLVVNGGKSEGVAYMSGTTRASKSVPAQPFELYVTDGGKGKAERNDMIMLFVGDETDQGDDGSADDEQGPCGFAEEVDGVSMARGNVQTWNNNTSEDQEPESRTALRLPSLLTR